MKKTLQAKIFGFAACASFLMLPNLASAACYATAASPLPYSVPAAGMTGAVTISAPAGCPWSFTPRTTWVRILSGTNYSGTATVYFQVLPNYTGRIRSVAFGPNGETISSGGIGNRSGGGVVITSQGFTITMTQQ